MLQPYLGVGEGDKKCDGDIQQHRHAEVDQVDQQQAEKTRFRRNVQHVVAHGVRRRGCLLSCVVLWALDGVSKRESEKETERDS